MMANEITTNLRVQLANGSLLSDFNPGRIQINQTGQGKFESVRLIATSETSVALTGITTPCVAIFYNLDATNYVEYDTVTAPTEYLGKLFPSGIPNILTLNTTRTTIYFKANTAACNVQIVVLEL